MAATAESMTATASAPAIRRAAFASLIGTTIEWYDFYLFVFCSALVFSKIFFAGTDPVSGYIGSVGTLVAAFVSRPLGGILFGHFGDTRGRKIALIVTLIGMGVVTCAIGLIPGYASWGYWSVAALVGLRLLQGIFFGGEWGGAVLMTVENSPARQRGWYGVFSQVGNPLGFFLASGMMQSIVLLTSLDDLLRWGWRWAFFASALLVFIGLYVRLMVTETRDFRNLEKNKTRRDKIPLVQLVAQYWRPLLLCMILQAGLLFGSYILIVYGANYTQRVLGLPANWNFIAGLVAAVANIVALLVMAGLSDRIGRKPIYMFGLLMYVLVPFPFFWLLGMKTLTGVILANTLVWMLAQAGTTAVQSSFLAELFPTEVRYSGISISYQLSTVVIGIPVSFLPVWVMSHFGSIYAVAAAASIGGLLGLLALIPLPETYRRQTAP
ncbi:MAG: MFS transporter [Pseudolabrys sp.]|jgi:MHS family shikimate/dehydroshikimate transporter-like MFS transporter